MAAVVVAMRVVGMRPMLRPAVVFSAMGVAGSMLRPAVVLSAMGVAGMRPMLRPAVVLMAMRVRGVAAPAVLGVVAAAAAV